MSKVVGIDLGTTNSCIATVSSMPLLYGRLDSLQKAKSTDSRHDLLRLKAVLHVRVCSIDKSHEGLSVDVTIRPDLNMPHILASAFQQARRIRKLGAAKKPDIDVRGECVDVCECRVSYTCGRHAVMQKFSDIVSTLAHGLKPVMRNCPQVTRMFRHPGIDGRIPFNRTGEPKELIHCVYTQK